MRNGFFARHAGRAARLRQAATVSVFALLFAGIAAADGDLDVDAINARVQQQLTPPEGSGRIETVSGQMYLSKNNIDAGVIEEALSAMLAQQAGAATSVAVHRAPRLNFEIHFPKNSARLTDESRASLDELAEALSADDYQSMRFILGGHTDQDGDAVVNQPLSEARARKAREYLVEAHGLDETRLLARGFGSSEPLFEREENAQEKLYNRRVDLRPLH